MANIFHLNHISKEKKGKELGKHEKIIGFSLEKKKRFNKKRYRTWTNWFRFLIPKPGFRQTLLWIVNTPLSLSLWPSRTTAIPDSASGTLTPAAIKVRPITVSGIPKVKPITVIIQTWKFNSIIRPNFCNSSHNLIGWVQKDLSKQT